MSAMYCCGCDAEPRFVDPCIGIPGPGSRRGRVVEYETSPEDQRMASFFRRPDTALSISSFGSPNARYRGLAASMSQPNLTMSQPNLTVSYNKSDSRRGEREMQLLPQPAFASFDGTQSARSLRLQIAYQNRALRLKSQSQSRLATSAEVREGRM